MGVVIQHCFLFLALSGIVFPAIAQERKNLWDHPLIKRFISPEKDTSRSAGFVVLPALGYAQETGLEFGLVGVYNFYANKADTTIRTSNVTFIGTFTTQRQTNLKLESDIWTTGNRYHYISELRFRNFPFNFYGLGNETVAQDKDVVLMQWIRVRLEGERELATNYYGGFNIAYERYHFSDEESGGIFESMQPYGHEGGYHLLLGISQLYDTRNRNTYTTKGHYARVKYAYSPGFGGGTNFRGSLVDVDLRTFFPLTGELTLGLNANYETSFGNRVPFYVYRELGGDMMMRGYYNGRYRDRSLLAAQGELRYRFHPRLGVAGFAGTGSTYHDGLSNTRFVPSFGGGIRYFFDLEHQSSIRLEYGFGEKRPGEKRQGGFYLALSEAF
ncbi:BamA/TamA family outer membrane protein [Parapedobacter sp. 10938]|uniref:BamA/TamA family outer membrane protein n=1 Tax=Parapedobacter flavus TaxID=3110225 RepID=UPI002DBFAAD5|nr:BamA/TamA family outer membrane protein [Parapedobacter sp. 10938]MEC3881101.1 BamA/TamA family outer membrane protein [Parapedobacter sp. 10938]